MDKNKSTTIEFDRATLEKLSELKVDPRESNYRLIMRLLKKGEKVNV
jgi:hypothetical protein